MWPTSPNIYYLVYNSKFADPALEPMERSIWCQTLGTRDAM